ncbi:MAG: hypothetical protein ACJ75B_22475 [Flavisolibacter sp.]
MLTIQTNKVNILGRILALLLIILGQSLIIKKGIIDGAANHEKGIGILYFLVLLLTSVTIAIFHSFFQVLKVEVHTSSGEITFTKAFSTLTIFKKDISGYYTTIYKGSRAKPWFGLLVKTVHHQTLRLTEGNLKSIHALKEFFEQQGLTYLGEKRPFFFQ